MNSERLFRLIAPTSEAGMKNFIDFIIDQSKDPNLGKEASDALVSASDAKSLSDWFSKKGYSVTPEESQKLIDNKAGLSQEQVNQSVKAGY